MDNHKAEFMEEAKDILIELEELLMELEKRSDDKELVGEVFRNLHTLKGSGSMFGFDEMARFTHQIENVFDMVRKGQLEVTSDLIDLSLKAKDHIKKMMSPEQEIDDSQSSELTAGFEAFQINTGTSPAVDTNLTDERPVAAPERTAEAKHYKGKLVTYRIRFAPAADVQESGTDVLKLLDEVRQLGPCRAMAYLNEIPPLDQLQEEHCYVYWDILLTTNRGKEAIQDVFIFIEDQSKIDIQVIDDGDAVDEDMDYKKLGNILVERGDLDCAEMDEVLHAQKRFGEILVDKGLIKGEKIESALIEQKLIRKLREERKHVETQSSIRVASDKLDDMVDLVGELVIMQSNLNQISTQLKNRDLMRISKMANRLIWDLREKSMDMRMSPIGNTFSRYKRLVRDLSIELGKDVELITEGGDTELDKTILDRLDGPLVHIIRNSVGHGIELPEEREAAGKNKNGTILLSASHSGPHIIIVIKDDGAGINGEAVKIRAIERGLIKKEDELSEKELLNLIFEPGFSTAESVTNVSGRGVGMDVVKKNVESLRGFISLASRPSEGTMVTLKIPLTLVIIEGLLLRIGTENFIIPLSIVERVVELKRSSGDNAGGGNFANVRGQLIPYIILRDHFGIEAEAAENEQIVIVEGPEQKVGFVVDRVIGEHQTVIKSLGNVYKNVEGLSGATILGDGNIALILDADRLISLAEHERHKS